MNLMKKSIVGAILFSSVVCIYEVCYAQGADIGGVLERIKEDTGNILLQVNKLPVYFEDITKMAKSWNEKKDEKKILADNQENFAKLNDLINKADKETRIPLTQEWTEEFLKAGSFRTESAEPPINANELTYSILAGVPLKKSNNPNEQKDIKANQDKYVKNYLKNLAADNFILKQPNPSWRDSDQKKQYVNYYNAVAAIKSFNTYVLTGLYKQEEKDKNSTDLINRASTPEWFEEVGSESLGLVFRQILMYQSQIYVMLAQMYKIQQQQVAAQAMTNTLLTIQIQQTIGDLLAQKALQANSVNQ